jgi:hypothetical protein
MTGITVRVADDPKLPRAAAPRAFGFSLKQIAAACLLSGLIAGGVSALTSESVAGNGPTSAFSVNRANKADRLPQAPVVQTPRRQSAPTPVLRMQGGVPVGCDRAFSPVADPANADVVRNCLT